MKKVSLLFKDFKSNIFDELRVFILIRDLWNWGGGGESDNLLLTLLPFFSDSIKVLVFVKLSDEGVPSSKYNSSSESSSLLLKFPFFISEFAEFGESFGFISIVFDFFLLILVRSVSSIWIKLPEDNAQRLLLLKLFFLSVLLFESFRSSDFLCTDKLKDKDNLLSLLIHRPE